jgi:hypothetical protein
MNKLHRWSYLLVKQLYVVKQQPKFCCMYLQTAQTNIILHINCTYNLLAMLDALTCAFFFACLQCAWMPMRSTLQALAAARAATQQLTAYALLALPAAMQQQAHCSALSAFQANTQLQDLQLAAAVLVKITAAVEQQFAATALPMQLQSVVTQHADAATAFKQQRTQALALAI